MIVDSLNLITSPNEHSAVLTSKQFDRYWRQDHRMGSGIHVIWGIENDNPEAVSIQFGSFKYTSDQAKNWLSDYGFVKIVRFDEATEKEMYHRYRNPSKYWNDLDVNDDGQAVKPDLIRQHNPWIKKYGWAESYYDRDSMGGRKKPKKKPKKKPYQKNKISAKVKTALENKVKDHNEKHGGDPKKRVTYSMLAAVFRRGVGAYNTNPSSVRPHIRSADEWAYARVNNFLRSIRTGKFRSGKHDTDLIPSGHRLSTRKNKDKITNFPSTGDNKKISIANSKFKQFTYSYALDLKENYPKLWKRAGTGGNPPTSFTGDDAFRNWTKYRKGERTPSVLSWIKRRERFANRHYKNTGLNGAIAHVKWGTVNSSGISGMKKVINEAKKKIRKTENLEKMSPTPTNMYPLASRSRAWDSDGAVQRVRRFTGSTESPSDSYWKAFMYHDHDNMGSFSAYKLPYLDVINGELKAVPKAIFSITAALRGARGGVDLPMGSRRLVMNLVNRYYKKMSKEFNDESMSPPFEKSSINVLSKSEPEEFPEDSDNPTKSYTAVIKNVNQEKRIVSGPVLVPEEKDLQEDVVEVHEIEKAAHDFMKSFQQINIMHSSNYDDFAKGIVPIESVVLKNDLDFYGDGEVHKKGTWILDVFVGNDEVWQLVKDGKIKGYSIEGDAKRVPIS